MGEEITHPGRIGECYLAGPTVFDGYYNSPEDDQEAFTSDGYFRSGDLFEIVGQRNQYYRFVGRRKSLIIRGGINISPEELDEVLNRHPSILDGAVASFPDPILGERFKGGRLPWHGCVAGAPMLPHFCGGPHGSKMSWHSLALTLKAPGLDGP